MRIAVEAAGLNFADVLGRAGLGNPGRRPPTPCVLGYEVAGRVDQGSVPELTRSQPATG